MSSLAPPSNLSISSTTTLTPTVSWTANGAQNCKIQLFDFQPSNGDTPLWEKTVAGNATSTSIQIPHFNNTQQVWVLSTKNTTRVPSQPIEVLQTRSQTLTTITPLISVAYSISAFLTFNKLANEPSLSYMAQYSPSARFNVGDQDMTTTDSSPFEIINLTPSTQQKLRIIPIEGSVEVGTSNVITFTTDVVQNIAISNLNVSNIGFTSATITYATSIAGVPCRIQFWVNNQLDGQIKNDTSRSITLSSYRDGTTQTIKIFSENDGSYKEGLGASYTFTTMATVVTSTNTQYLGDNIGGVSNQPILTHHLTTSQVVKTYYQGFFWQGKVFDTDVEPQIPSSQGNRGNIIVDVIMAGTPDFTPTTNMMAVTGYNYIDCKERLGPNTFRFRIPYRLQPKTVYFLFYTRNDRLFTTQTYISSRTSFTFEVHSLV